VLKDAVDDAGPVKARDDRRPTTDDRRPTTDDRRETVDGLNRRTSCNHRR